MTTICSMVLDAHGPMTNCSASVYLQCNMVQGRVYINKIMTGCGCAWTHDQLLRICFGSQRESRPLCWFPRPCGKCCLLVAPFVCFGSPALSFGGVPLFSFVRLCVMLLLNWSVVLLCPYSYWVIRNYRGILVILVMLQILLEKNWKQWSVCFRCISDMGLHSQKEKK